ncbi:hypothetical protein L228DRAFT_56410 [Xylona heveae TC161]|uniref:Uncharacterized protein n=1 Tax=Xylona heveae (strain CBS 132557 / TC161) TaxID=1328760 RepID=A0A164Z7Q5_XYLHT|nr:hypothetical protein L228DRAFT_56410 [Xylona heveae TC161]KZF18790.1 hypothetical protein L228DRAFT_56410 [Xylona heveae TC161]
MESVQNETGSLALQKSNLIRDDSVQEQIAGAYLGTLAVNIQHLNADWGSISTANRPLRSNQAKALADQFLNARLQKEPLENRIIGGCDLTAWNELLNRAQLDKPAEREAMKNARHRYHPTLAMFPSVPDIRDLSLLLFAGQHRQAAIRHVLCVHSDNFTGDEKDAFVTIPMWPCDFYDVGRLDHSAMLRLQENRRPMILPESDGDLWARLSALLEPMSDGERDSIMKSKTSFQTWASQVSRIDGKDAQRFITLLRHPLKDLLDRICATPWGRETAKISAFDRMARTRLDQVWRKLFHKTFEGMRDLLGNEHSAKYTRQDVEIVRRIAEQDYVTELYVARLFYPTEREVRSKSDLVKLDDAVRLAGNDHLYRRYQLFSYLSEQEYHTLFMTVLKRTPEVHTFSELAALANGEMTIASHVIEHIVHWLNPTYTKPANASKERRNEQWVDVLTRELEPGTPPAEGQEDTGGHRARGLVDHLIEMITGERRVGWQEKALASTYTPPPSEWTEMKPREAAIAKYQKRFEHETWCDVLQLVKDNVPSAHLRSFLLDGLIEQDPKSKPWTSWATKTRAVMWRSLQDSNAMHLVSPRVERKIMEHESAIFCTRLMYSAIKRRLQRQSERDLEPPSRRTRAREERMTMDEVNNARHTLRQYAEFLQSKGYNLNADDDQEDVSWLSLELCESDRADAGASRKRRRLPAPTIPHDQSQHPEGSTPAQTSIADQPIHDEASRM